MIDHTTYPRQIFESSTNDSLPYKMIHLDNSVHYYKYEEDLWCWNNLLFDFKPWYTHKRKTLYRTRTLWIVKTNGISSIVKFKRLRDALKELFYFTDILYLRKNRK
jgi:hypothetical protein